MNVQMPLGGTQRGGVTTFTDEEITIRRKRQRLTVGAVLAALLVLAAAWYLMTRGDGPQDAKAADAKSGGPGGEKGGRGGSAPPPVTVIVPGRSQVASIVNASGSLAARRDMQVGVAGEGGLVARVLVDAGAWVRQGQVLATIERSVQAQQANQITAQIAAARADASLAQSELDRSQALVARGFVSKADIDRKSAARDSAHARVRVVEAQLAETRARIGRLDIRAPAAGLILDRNVEVGQVVSAGSPALFRMARGGEMELQAQMAQADLARMRVGLPALVTPVGSSETVRGSIWQISPVIDPQSRQGEVRIAVPYTRAMRPGGFAEARITSGAVTAPLVPQSAVQSDVKGNYVYIVGRNNEVERRDIKVGSVSNEGVSIIGGLTGQEQVVLSAAAFLNPGQKISPRRAAARS